MAIAYDLPVKDVRGYVNTDYYYNNQYDKILGYTENEFIYPELYKKMKQALVSKERLQECVKFFQAKYEAERQAKALS